MHVGFYVISPNEIVALIGRLNQSSMAHSSCLVTKLCDKSTAPVMLKELFPQTYLRGTAHSVALEQPAIREAENLCTSK
jgi:hypothetical protein